MIEALRARLQNLLVKKERLEKVELMLKDLEEEHSNLIKQSKLLQVKVNQEQIDVDRLTKLTPTHLFYAVIGKQQERLSKEQQEVYVAQLKLRNQLIQVEQCQERINSLTAEKEELLGIKDEYHKLSAEIKAYLKDDEEIRQLEEKIARCKAQNIELEEAYYAGCRVIADCDDVLESLQSASNWGLIDMLGGDTISTLVKHSHLDKAQSKLENLQTSLQHFKNEFVDLKPADDNQFNFELGTFMNFADYIFDNVFVDYSIQSKIKDFKHQVGNLKEKVEKLSLQLKKLHQLNLKEIHINEQRLNQRIHSI